MRIPRLAFLLILALALLNTPAAASTIVVPNLNASQAGDPDGVADANTFSFRDQQMFGSGQFISIGSPILIDQFAFRPFPGTGNFSVTADTVDIYASTSPRFPNLSGPPNTLMSSTFADNIGPDNTLVYHGPLTLSGQGCAGPGPCPFNILFNFQTPFFYNPLQGRLLLDIFVTNWNASANSTWDAANFQQNFGPVASVFGLAGEAVGEFEHSGEITQFRFTAVPEPATMTLILSGFGAFAARRRFRATR